MNATLLTDAVAGRDAIAGDPQTGGSAASHSSGQVAQHLIAGTSGLGISTLVERGAGFLANTLAARWGGAATFGTYSLAISTANNIATYAGAGIGATATRFSGKYPWGSAGYRMLARVLGLVSLLSAGVAALALWLCAKPLALLIGQNRLVGVMHWAALSAGAVILLECARGFFVGQRRLRALLLLSLTVGAGMLFLIPFAARRHNANSMLLFQGGAIIAAVLVCILLARPLGLLAHRQKRADSPQFLPLLREVWGFGFMQLAGLVGTNVAGWWLLTLVARSDISLVQMGFFSIASQLRNIVGVAPGLFTEGSFAVMADPRGEAHRTPQQVLGLVTFASLMVSYLMAATAILLLPWLLRALYSAAYAHAAPAVAIALALAVMHMGNAPASARLSILSVRTSGVINALWAVFVAGAGALLIVRGISAAIAMLVFFGAHTLSAALVLIMLRRRDSLPRRMASCFAIATGGTALLAALASARDFLPEHTWTLTAAIGLAMLATLGWLAALGRESGWLPTRSMWMRILRHFRAAMPWRPSHAL